MHTQNTLPTTALIRSNHGQCTPSSTHPLQSILVSSGPPPLVYSRSAELGSAVFSQQEREARVPRAGDRLKLGDNKPRAAGTYAYPYVAQKVESEGGIFSVGLLAAAVMY